MISLVIDKIENAPLYYGLGERFRKALEWLAAVDPSTLSPGEKVPIDGENVYGLLFQVDTLAPEDCKLEGHQNYADIQCLVSGLEAAGYALTDTPLEPLGEYDAKSDGQFFTGDWDTLTIRPGTFYIVLPQVLHAPRMACGRVGPVTRLVGKVKL